MDALPVKRLSLADLPEGTFEHNSGVRLSKRQLLEPTDLHCHDCFEIEFILSGTGSHLFNGLSYVLTDGVILLLTPVDFHQVIPIDNLQLYNIMFPEHLITSELLTHLWSIDSRQRTFPLSPLEREKVLTLFNLLLLELQGINSYKKEYIKDLLECIFIVILQHAERRAPPVIPQFDEPVQRALSYLHSHFRQNPSLSEIAAIAQYTPNYFCSIFRKNTGKTYNHYLNDLKLDFAKQLLLSSNLSVTEICYTSGFTSLSHFLRLFKATYQISPQTMRTSRKASNS